MNVFKRIYKKLNAVSMAAALVVGVGAAVAMGNVSAQSCATLGAPYDPPGNSVIGNGAPSVTKVQSAYASDATVRDIYNASPFNITTADVNNLCSASVVTGTITRGGDLYVGSKLVGTNAITAGRDYIAGSTKVTNNGFTFYERTPAIGFAAGVQSLTAYIFMQNGQALFGIMSACGNPIHVTPTPPEQGTLVCKNLILNTGTTDSKGNQTDTLTASATASNANLSSYVFDFGNGKTQTINSSATSVTSESQTYAPGTYTAKVTVSGVANNIYSVAPKSVTCTKTFTVQPVGSLVCASLALSTGTVDNKTGNISYTLTAQATAQNATIKSYTFHFGDTANSTQTVTTSAAKATSKSFTYLAGQTYSNIYATVTGTGANGTALTSSTCKTNLKIPAQTCATGSTATECQPTCTSPTNGQTYPVGSAQCSPTCTSPTTGQTYPVGSSECQTTPVTPTALVNTGPGSTVAMFLGVTFIATAAHHFFVKRRIASQLQ
ncbi:MAG TPA: hypothetical protein VIM53_02590 [Candidatus Saccharimonadales bacterium]